MLLSVATFKNMWT